MPAAQVTEKFLIELENVIQYFFTRDVLNYAPLMSVHLAQMDALADTNNMQKDFHLFEVLHEKPSELYNYSPSCGFSFIDYIDYPDWVSL